MGKPTRIEAKRLLRTRIITETLVYLSRGRVITVLPDEFVPSRWWLERMAFIEELIAA